MVGFLETQSATNQVEAIYVAYFGRAGDGPGYTYWTNQFNAQEAAGSPAPSVASNIADSFAVQPEATAKYPFLANPPNLLNPTDPVQIASVDSFINTIYQDLFSRVADSAGLAYWQGQILSGVVTVGDAVYDIANGALGTDQTVLADKIAAATSFTTDTVAANTPVNATLLSAAITAIGPVVDAASLAASQAASAAFAAHSALPNLTLTPAQDTLVTSASGVTFNAPLVATSTEVGAFSFSVQTLTVGDSLTDSAGDGTLNATLNGNVVSPAVVANVTMTGIATANLTNVGGALAGFEGNVTGLTTVNESNSNAGLQLGTVGAGLLTALTNVNVAGFFGPNGSILFDGVIAAAAGSAANTINVGLSGLLGSTLDADVLSFGTDGAPGTKASPNLSYGTWALTVNSPANLQLEQNGVGGATTLTIAGAGNVALGQDGVLAIGGNWQKLTTIDASASTGNVTITGKATTFGSNAAASLANPGGLFGSAVGLLTGNTALTSFSLSGGAGVNTLDVSSFTTTAQLAALTTVAGTNTATTNEIIVTSANADTVSASTFANIKGFQILGDVAPGSDTGTVNLANLPSSIDDILYQTASMGALTINTLPSAFTVDTEANGGGNALTIGAVGPAGGTADSLTLIVGSATATGVGVGAVTMTGEEIVTLTLQGPAGSSDTVGFMSLTPTLTGNEHVNIGGTAGVLIGSGGLGAIADLTAGGALNTNNLVITDTDSGTASVVLHGATGGALFTPIVGDTAAGSLGNPLTNSTNAVTIDAHTAVGGLIMEAGDANFTTSMTVSGSTGDTITGSSTAGNVLGGSIGNDTIVGTTSTTAADTIYTGGGADAITLAAGHTAVDHVELYSGFDTPGIVAGGVEVGRFASIVDANDIPQLGWWGQATGATAAQNAGTNMGTALGFGTTADMSTVSNFAAAQDVVDISVTEAFNSLVHNAATGAIEGVTFAAATNSVGVGGSVTSATGDVLLLGGTYANATALATSLAGAGFITFGPAGLPSVGGTIGDHVIVAYSDGSNVRIADLDIHTTAATTIHNTAGSATETVAVSDMVQLTGVSLASLHLTAALSNIHFVA